MRQSEGMRPGKRVREKGKRGHDDCVESDGSSEGQRIGLQPSIENATSVSKRSWTVYRGTEGRRVHALERVRYGPKSVYHHRGPSEGRARLDRMGSRADGGDDRSQWVHFGA